VSGHRVGPRWGRERKAGERALRTGRVSTLLGKFVELLRHIGGAAQPLEALAWVCARMSAQRAAASSERVGGLTRFLVAALLDIPHGRLWAEKKDGEEHHGDGRLGVRSETAPAVWRLAQMRTREMYSMIFLLASRQRARRSAAGHNAPVVVVVDDGQTDDVDEENADGDEQLIHRACASRLSTLVRHTAARRAPLTQRPAELGRRDLRDVHGDERAGVADADAAD
jgi:hypothetical protein